MADVIPFHGICYNTEIISNMADVVTPPFDVISKREQEAFLQRHSCNMVHLILNKPTDADTPENNPHTRARRHMDEWTENRCLVRDGAPAFYLTTMTFEHDGREYVRTGLIAAVRLEPFEKGVVLPHEKTFSNVKTERLGLMKSCNTNFSPIFALFSDNGSDVFPAIGASLEGIEPDFAFTAVDGIRHAMWRVTDEKIQAAVTASMKDTRIFIADGHHRYETALAYKEWVRSRKPELTDDHPVNFVMMYLCAMEDPGLIILSAHRMLLNVPDDALAGLIPRAEEYFDIQRYPLEGADLSSEVEKFIDAVQAETQKTAIGVVKKDEKAGYVFLLKPGVMDRLFGNELSPVLLGMDVTALTRLIFMEILGFDEARLNDESAIAYSKSAREAAENALSGECDAAFILNPTRIGQVRQVAENGLVMPRKATYFYPKVGAGLVLNRLD